MIAYLPEIYPDELVYSWFCRYYVHTGALTHKSALSDMFCKRSDTPIKEFIGNLNTEIKSKIQEIYPIKRLILEHTMFNQYARFIPLAQKKKALYHLEFDYCDTHHLFSILPRAETDRFLKYCPVCAEEDREKYGEAYWHRKHQIRGMQVCYKHGYLLKNSSVKATSEQTYTFSPAEEQIPKIKPKPCKITTLLEYSRYMAAVFDAPINLNNDIPISAVFYHAMSDTRYMAVSGKARHTKQLVEDINAYYKSIGINNIASIYQIQRVLLGDRYDFSVICQIAHYLGKSVEDLTAPKLTVEQIEQEEKAHYIRDRPPLDWNEYDNEIAPLLEQIARDIYDGTASEIGRPERVSEKVVYRALELSAHRLENLPKCRAIFERYTESYEENYARRVIWAYRKLKAERQTPFYSSDIRVLAGVKKVNMIKSLPYIEKHADKATAEQICRLLLN